MHSSYIVERMIKQMRKTYSELIKIPTYEERYRYLRIGSKVGEETFGYDRYLNQVLYNKTSEWKRCRNSIIIRDNGFDMAFPGRTIQGKIFVHHINPITLEDINRRDSSIFDPENLVCVSFDTHQAIHYGDESLLHLDIVERKPNDTIPWR